MRTLVLGIGNILLRDEGIGVRVVEAMEQRYDLPPEVDLLDGGTAGMDLLHILSEYDRLIVCDAVKSQAAPGTVLTIPNDDVPAYFQLRLSPHQVGLADVLATLKLLGRGPRTTTIVGVVPADLELGTELSATARLALEQALTRVLEELQCEGLTLNPCAQTGAADERLYA